MRPPSLWQILIIVLVIVLIFGAKRLPDVASSIGKSLKIFKKEVSELREDDATPPPSGPVSGGPTSPSTTPNPTTAPPSADDPGSTPPGGAGR
ncbi:twin-arginine translocase TatA/TatE family subunit [Georgenia phoenicis]|uniref:twin-arginine translocase TatA/TatE family subunit n=1 Tax=unclassified Georgenia TaxID=2626815 RepID=UPI0039AEABC6